MHLSILTCLAVSDCVGDDRLCTVDTSPARHRLQHPLKHATKREIIMLCLSVVPFSLFPHKENHLHAGCATIYWSSRVRREMGKALLCSAALRTRYSCIVTHTYSPGVTRKHILPYITRPRDLTGFVYRSAPRGQKRVISRAVDLSSSDGRSLIGVAATRKY